PFTRDGSLACSQEALGFVVRHLFEFLDQEPLDLGGQLRNSWSVEQASQAELYAEGIPYPTDELRPEQRVAADQEEIVFHADPSEAQQRRQDPRHALLRDRSGFDEAIVAYRVRGVRRREGGPVDLAMRVQG